MNTTEFESYIKGISEDLYIEPTDLEDRKRVMIKHPKGKSPIYVCAVPAGELREEPDNGYQDSFGGRYPTKGEVEAKIRLFVEKLPDNLDLYD